MAYRIALLDHTGAWLETVGEGIKALGHEARMVTINEDKDPEIDSTLKFLKEFKPDFCITENFHCFDLIRPKLALPLEDYLKSEKIPTAVWMVDGPQSSGSYACQDRWQKGYAPDFMSFFCADRKDISFFKNRALPVLHLPVGVDHRMESYRAPLELKSRFETNLSFCGTPTHNAAPAKNLQELKENFLIGFLQMFTQQLKRIEDMVHIHRPEKFHELVEKMVAPVETFFSKFYTTPQDFHQAHQQVDNEMKNLLPEGLYSQWNFFSSAMTFFYSHYQLAAYLNELKPFEIKIYGGMDWKNLLLGYNQVEPRLSEQELYAQFAYSKINFGLTKWHFWGAVQERAFWVLGAGGFPLLDSREEVYEMFTQDEIATYTTIDEAKDKIRFYLQNETERKRIAENGRKKVFANYTYRDRMKSLIATMKKDWALRS
ncbi:MAG: glycosyltransferase family 1 protein [Deltaproteobacteria bacterium]|nr:glycosyltransferase family 1 protein [Deltaproteobacteria bacterium]